MSAFGKIGLHVLRNGVEPAELATAPCLCLVDCSVEYILQVREANPGAWIVVRWVVRDQDSYLKDPEKGAERWFKEHEADIRAVMGPRVVFQGLNEIASSQSAHYVAFEDHRAGLLWAIAAGLGLGAWSVGEPDWYVWGMFRHILNGMDADDAILLHEYWADASDLDKRWYTARWTDERVWPMVRGHNIIVTECGRDRIGERGAAGWRRTINAEGFLVEVARYDRLLQETPEVIGGCGFTDGIEGEWIDFSWKPLWPRITATQEAPMTEPLPEHETATDAETMAEKARWWSEEITRALEAGLWERARQRQAGLTALLYRLENRLKERAI